MTTTPERRKYNDLVIEFSKKIPNGAVVYDIGVSAIHNYSGCFRGRSFFTIDRDLKKNPDIALDLEIYWSHPEYFYKIRQCSAVLCNGVVEQCGNPYTMMMGLNRITKSGGSLLLGCISIGYPIYDNDFVRFTPAGATRLVEMSGFIVDSKFIVDRENVPSYTFLLCTKK